MTGAGLLFVLSGALALGGGACVVASRRSPLVQAAGLAVSMVGVGIACGLGGAPGVGAVQAVLGLAMALVASLVGVDWVGTGRDGLPSPSTGRLLARGGLALALLVALAIGLKEVMVLPLPPAGDVAPAGAVGIGLFGRGPGVVAAVGLLMLAAIVGASTLLGRGRS
jgi:NADH:ubiquinone oxidoreductase subunit 6 (subunit J)